MSDEKAIWLPNDVSRCRNEACDVKEDCLRWLTRGKGGNWTSYSSFEGGKDCAHKLTAEPYKEHEE